MLTPLALGLVAGTASLVFLAGLPDAAALGVCLLLVTGSLLAGWRWLAPSTRQCLIATSGFVIGLWWGAWTASALLASRLPPDHDGQDVLLTVEVLSMRQHADGSASWTVAAESLPWAEGCRLPGWHCRLRVGSWQPMPLSPGERWQLQVRLKRPHAPQNEGGADFERFLFGERVVATGSIRESAENKLLEPAKGFAAWRAYLLAASLPLVGDGPGDVSSDEAELFGRAVLPALVVDERSLMATPQWRVLADTGTAHLVAISGLHVALLWGAVIWIFALARRHRVARVRYQHSALLVALSAAFVYAAIAGMPLPAQRAVVMLAVATAFLLAGGAVPGWRIWLAAAAVVLLIDPLAVHAAGFWLSFGAVGLLLLLHDVHRRRHRPETWTNRILVPVMATVHAQWLLTVLLAPLLLALFGTASVSSVLANLPAIPWVNLLALPPALVGMLLAPLWPAAADPLIDLAVGALALLWHWLLWVDSLAWLRPVAMHGATIPGLWALAVALPVLLLSRAWPVRLAMVAVAVLAWPVAPVIPGGQADVCVFDVGQGLAVGVRTAGHAVLYDTGPGRGAEADAAGTTVVPALRAWGVAKLDILVVSHDDPQHAGAVAPVVRAFAPRLRISGDLRALPDGAGSRCDRDRDWQLDGVRLRLIAGDLDGPANDRSCVLQVDAGGRRLLVPGDIGRRRELALSAAYGDALRSDVLVAGNHGGKSSSSATFLARVSPQLLVSSSGYLNRHGHPHPEVRALAGALGAQMLATPETGALCFRLGPDGIVTTRQRQAGARHWHF
ncbi:MAG: DNA internalization-related competence protein ComEC/Rec2 [Gammaproteobacteria bacterium]